MAMNSDDSPTTTQPVLVSTQEAGNNQVTSSSSSSEGSPPQETVNDALPVGANPVKGTKRKRLSKACDACHKSKRRCDGTAPCSNCYFASKVCTYTDASGRRVPAPRNLQQIAQHDPLLVDKHPLYNNAASAVHLPSVQAAATVAAPMPIDMSAQIGPDRDAIKKRTRPEREALMTRVPLVQTVPAVVEPILISPTLLDPVLTHELTNLFFTHCNPQRLIIHKPTFSAQLSMNQVPWYLVLAVCALAAPLSKTCTQKSSIPRLAGVPFFQEAVSMMFDGAGRLLSDPCLATAQALCLLEMHEIAASHSWTKHYRYFDLALQVLEESLDVTKPDDPLLTPVPSPASLKVSIERECTRRCFWLMQSMGWINGIYTHKPMRPRVLELMPMVRLPIDETSFELSVHAGASAPEYIQLPAPRTRYASQFGHVCRILSLYSNLNMALASKEGDARAAVVIESRIALDAWIDSLPDHLRFTPETLETQIAMFETSSNTGAWCYCFMHVLYPCTVLSLMEGEGKLAGPILWVRNQLNMIFDAVGTRAKNTILSACALWSYSKYQPDDPLLHKWDSEFEKVWGFRVALVADEWRRCQAVQREKQQKSQSGSPEISQQESLPTSTSSASTTAAASSTRVSPTSSSASLYSQPQQQREGKSSNTDYSKQNKHMEAHNPKPKVIQPAQSLPSLKASGLLDSWKPAVDSFAQTLSLSPRLEEEERISRPAVNQANSVQRTSSISRSGVSWMVNET